MRVPTFDFLTFSDLRLFSWDAYYINFDNLYETDEPDYDILRYLHNKGKLVAFNFGYSGPNVNDNIARFKPIYKQCHDMGIIDHSYIYGFDEAPESQFASLEDSVKAIKKEFRDVMTLTTAKDPSYGNDSVVKSMDACCPLTPDFDPAKASAARAAGRGSGGIYAAGRFTRLQTGL